MDETQYLESRDLWLAYSVVEELFRDEPEPMPTWEEGDPGKLDQSCHCIEPRFGFDKYPSIPAKAAKLLYSTIKAHCFPNGNKRFGLSLTILFLTKNGWRLPAEGVVEFKQIESDRPVEMPDGSAAEWATTMAVLVASSQPHEPHQDADSVVTLLAKFFTTTIRPRAQK